MTEDEIQKMLSMESMIAFIRSVKAPAKELELGFQNPKKIIQAWIKSFPMPKGEGLVLEDWYLMHKYDNGCGNNPMALPYFALVYALGCAPNLEWHRLSDAEKNLYDENFGMRSL